MLRTRSVRLGCTLSRSASAVRGFSLAVSLAVLGCGTMPLHGGTLNFHIWATGNLADMQAGNQGAEAQAMADHVMSGFMQAGSVWESDLADAMTVDLDVDFGPRGAGVLGNTISTFISLPYGDVRNAMIVDSKSADDQLATAHLQPGPAVEFITNDTSFDNRPNLSPRIRDNDGSMNNTWLSITNANAKALGFDVLGGPDASILFSDFADYGPSNTLSWDFDRSDGIDSNAIDFVGVAAHEIGHALGFVSGVGIVDLVGSPNFPTAVEGGIGPLDLDPIPVFSVLDMFRYTEDSLSYASQPTGGLNDLAFGRPSVSDRPYFSIDGGVTHLGQFTTGLYNGSGREPGHWRDNVGLGLMDPTVTTGVLYSLSNLDLVAFDVIGYDRILPVPEPGGLSLAAIWLITLIGGSGTWRGILAGGTRG